MLDWLLLFLVEVFIPAHLNFQPVVSEQQPQSTTAPVRNYQTGMVLQHGNMSRNTLHALSATPKPKYTDAWVNQKQSEKRKSTPNENFNGNYNNHWLIQEAEQRRIEQQRLNQHKRQSLPLQQSINNWNNSNGNTQHHHYNNQQQNPNQISSALIQRNGSYDNKPLPESVIQTITQRVQSKGIGERMKRI
uniref:Zasp-like motif domain-containing protein n=1 Tax=Megaselia scalaris TaxID=36166 RepID=T1GHQ8_MEGSC